MNLSTFYKEHGLMGEVGFGERPALLVVDFSIGFTDRSSPLGADYSKQLAVTKRLVDRAHQMGVVVIFTTIVFSGVDAAEPTVYQQKIPAFHTLSEGSPMTEVDASLGFDPARDVLIRKRGASAFFGTDLTSHLVARSVDTLIITGCTTSGCVRASAIDACQYGFRTIVVEDAVGDRAHDPHEANLFDINAKYADVLPSARVMEYLCRLRGTSTVV